MPNSPIIDFNEVDLSIGLSSNFNGIAFVQGKTKRGETNDPKEIIRSWPQFERRFGGLLDDDDFPFDCKRALESGSWLRVNSLRHYTDITDKTTIDAEKAVFIPYCFLKISAAFVTSNAITFNINAVAISTVNFTTNSDNTLSLLKDAILAHADVDYAEIVNPGTASVSDDRYIIFYKNSTTPLTIASISVTGGASQPTMTITNESMLVDANGANIASIAPKNYGADYDNFNIVISDASNGDANYFNITIEHTLEDISDSYENITIPGSPTALNSHYFDDIIKYNDFVTITYQDLSALSTPIRPRNGTYRFIGGDDGSSLVDNDYIGDQGQKLGFYAFDNYDDARVISCMSHSADAVHGAGADYADTRQDLVYVGHIDNAATTADDIVADREASGVNTSFATFIAGGLVNIHPTTSIEYPMAEIGDYIGLIGYTEKKFGYWRAIEGLETGRVKNTLRVVNNFGGPGSYNDANLLSNRGINLVVNRSSTIQFWHNVTAYKVSSDLQNLNVRFFLIGLKKVLKPFLETFVGQPNDPVTWKKIYLKIKPYLEELEGKRAIYKKGWRYDGDQFATGPDDYTVNLPSDVAQGKYKVRLYLKIIPALQEISFDFVITPQGVAFEDVTNLV